MNKHFAVAIVAASAWVASASGHARAAENGAQEQAAWIGETGSASYYASKYQGRRMSNGARFDQKKLTAAHPWLPLGTKMRVTVPGTNRSVVVTITDRLHARHRVVDLSLAAARVLGIVSRGVAEVQLEPA